MPDPKPVPPKGYTLQDLPDFLRESNQGTKIIPAPPKSISNGNLSYQVAAGVDPNDPKTIKVRDVTSFTKPTYTHEATHVYQLSRNPEFLAGQANAKSVKDFDYGGVEGLLKSQQDRKTIADFSLEQQAQMVSDYQRLTAEAIKRGDAAGLAKITAAYHPFVNQLAKIPPRGADMTKMTKQDLSPIPPSPPPATVAGMPMMPDKLIGGSTPQFSVAQLKAMAMKRKPQ